MIEETIRTALLTDATVTGIVSERIYPKKLPQNTTLEAITFDRISGARDVALSGASGTGRARIRYNCWAARWREAMILIAAVKVVLDNISGAVAATSEIDFYDDEAEAYMASIDYYFHTEE